MIKYKNGEKDVFNQDNASPGASTASNASGPKMIDIPVAANNDSLVALYKKQYEPVDFSDKDWKYIEKKTLKDEKKDEYLSLNNNHVLLGISSSSILSNEHLEVNVLRDDSLFGLGLLFGSSKLVFRNKTDRVIYIDLGNCFHGNEIMYNDDITLKTESKGSSSGLNLGAVTSALGIGGIAGTLASGITIGSNSSSSTTTVEKKNRYLSIAPFGEVSIEYLSIHYGSDWTQSFVPLKCYSFTEQTSPDKECDRIWITYSLSPTFESYSMIKISFYVKQYFRTTAFNKSGSTLLVYKNLDKYSIVGRK